MSQPTGHAAFRQGRPVALADACWHRSAPLSPGKLRGDDEIMCGYRGSCYDAKGRATFQSLDAAVGAVVIDADGDHFSAGPDLGEMAEHER